MNKCKPIIDIIPLETFLKLSEDAQKEYLRLYREQVAPKFEEWRRPARIKCGHGGRGAGAKSRSTCKLLIEFAEHPDYFGENIRVICLRSVQKSIRESSWSLLKDTIKELGYTDFKVTENQIKNLTNGSYFTFAGLNDLSVSDLKSLNNYNIAYVEESDEVSESAWLTLLATIRKEWVYNGQRIKSEIWAIWNPNTNHDAVYDLFCRNPEPDWIITDCKAGYEDNPWFPRTLYDDWMRLKKNDPEEALHVFEGFPRVNQQNSVWSVTQFVECKDRKLSEEDKSGCIEIGVDVARFGNDCSVAIKRKGYEVLEVKKVKGYDTQGVAGMVWDMANKDKSVLIKIDIGYNQGVYDLLVEWGANVVPVGFGETAEQSDVYSNKASEMMFELPVDKLSIPECYFSQTLREDITERMFFYDQKGRKRLEPKDESTLKGTKSFKARHGGRSPDEGDALCLAFYETRQDMCF